MEQREAPGKWASQACVLVRGSLWAWSPLTLLSSHSFTSTLAVNDPLQTLFQLMSGRVPQAATVLSVTGFSLYSGVLRVGEWGVGDCLGRYDTFQDEA